MKRRAVLKSMTATGYAASASAVFQSLNIPNALAVVDGQTILWSGISYTAGDERELPNVIGILDDKNTLTKINFSLSDSLNSIPSSTLEEKGMKLIIGGATGQERYADHAMVFAVSQEMTISDIKIQQNSQRLTALRLSGSVFIYNIETSTIVNMFPILAKSYNYSVDGNQDLEIRDQYLELLSGVGEYQETIANYFKNSLLSYPFSNQGNGLFSHVSEVTNNDRFLQSCDALGRSPELVRKWVGNIATYRFGNIFKTNVIPFTDSKATRADIAIRIDDTDRVLKTRTTEADCKIKPHLQGWVIQYTDDPDIDSEMTVEIILALRIRIFDSFDDDKRIYNQRFIATVLYKSPKDENQRRDPFSYIVDLYEELLDRGFKSIIDEGERKNLISGIEEKLGDAGDIQTFGLSTKDEKVTNTESNAVKALLLI